MVPKPILTLVLSLALACTAACGQAINLEKLEVTETLSGWYDAGIVDGLNKLVPSVSFRLRNNGAVPATDVQLLVSFWQDGDDGERDSSDLRGIGRDPVQPAGTSEPILVRSKVGYTLEQARSELFTHRSFRDWTAKIFAKRDGKIVPIGQVRIERRILPQSFASARP